MTYNVFGGTLNLTQSIDHDVKELLNIWHGLQQSAIDGALNGQRVFAPAYDPKQDIVSSE